MLKVVIFDSGWGGDLAADCLEQNLAVVEIIRVIDWRHAPYTSKSRHEICQLAEEALQEYCGKVDVIVLTNFVAHCALKYLQRRYPEQKFICITLPSQRLDRQVYHKVMVLTTTKVRRSLSYQKWRRGLKNKTVVEPCCDHWETLIDDGELTEQQLWSDLEPYRTAHVDTVILGSAHLWDLAEQIEQALGWQATVLDPRPMFVAQVCKVLGF